MRNKHIAIIATLAACIMATTFVFRLPQVSAQSAYAPVDVATLRFDTRSERFFVETGRTVRNMLRSTDIRDVLQELARMGYRVTIYIPEKDRTAITRGAIAILERRRAK